MRSGLLQVRPEEFCGAAVRQVSSFLVVVLAAMASESVTAARIRKDFCRWNVRECPDDRRARSLEMYSYFLAQMNHHRIADRVHFVEVLLHSRAVVNDRCVGALTYRSQERHQATQDSTP